jgi:D-xylose transport system ATP-binding protein
VTSPPLLEVRGVTKRFGSVHALGGVDLDCGVGEVVALVGDNGAGKSTLVKIISGAIAADRGTLRLDGIPIPPGPEAAAGLGVGTVYQDLALCDNLDVVANLFLGREPTRPGPAGTFRRLDEAAMEQAASATLRRLGLELADLRSAVATLSGGQRQAVALARAAIGTARLVVLDEPTAALGVEGTRRMLDLVRRLRDDGRGVIVTSHSLPDVFAVSDRIAVLRLGQNAATFRAADVTPEEVVGAITGWRDRVGEPERVP